ncbi:restriction endonuclease subunit S [Acinetobacter sp. A3]|uniref:restriction endonuclease subunit S n=1 Tax=Acinetobacter sp. A3 TaxID=2725492 RepID=UPI00144888C1|nr:restriction endonuclease subunit S [Acinetobacter sp. A3]
MAKYQKYAEYKDSGVKWLGLIPKHWSSYLFKRVVSDIKDGTHGTHARVENGELLLSAKNVFNSGLEIGENESYIPIKDYKEITSNGFPQKGDILVTCVGTIGRSFVYPFDKSLAFQRSVSFIRLNKKGNAQFYKYFIESKAYQSQLESLVKSSAQGGIYMGDLINTVVINCPLDEQVNIANFLDHETAKIDTLIAKQEKLIELLKEKRQAVISHAVTNGLNPDVTMKDSGVEWLGQVPEHWVIGRLKNVLSIKNGRDYKTVEVEIGGYPVYGSGGIFKRSSAYLYDGVSILFGRKGTVDKPLLVEGRFWTVDTMFYSELDAGTDPEYIYFQSLGFPFDMLSTNTALPSMTQEDLLNLGFVIPPYNEQKAISEYIQDYLKKSNSLMKKAESAIQLMQERRTALISSAVTGKIDVRNWQHPNEAKTELSL